jgi:type IV secretory pathway VirJ component
MSAAIRRAGILSLAVALGAAPACALTPPRPSVPDSAVRGLPLVEVPAARPGETLAIVISGDGGWAPLVREVARSLSDAGVGVVGLDARAYLTGAARTPESSAADVARIARAYGARWHATRLVLVGYSRGADMLPFVATRLPEDVRGRVALLAMFGLATRSSFEFHWVDMVRDTRRASDLPVPPELTRLRGTPMLCVYGTDETDSACRDADASLLTRVARDGAHHFDKDYAGLARLVLDALVASPARSPSRTP